MRDGQVETVDIDFDSQGALGRFEDRLELTFEDFHLSKRFAIVRPVAVIVGNREDHEAIKPTAPYVPRVRKAAIPERSLAIDEGPKPPALAEVKWVVRLPTYDIPSALEDVIASTRNSRELITRLKTDFLPSRLRTDSYTRHFQTLLHVEEAQLKFVLLQPLLLM